MKSVYRWAPALWPRVAPRGCLRSADRFLGEGAGAYAGAKASEGRIDETTLYRIQRQKGRVKLLNAELVLT